MQTCTRGFISFLEAKHIDHTVVTHHGSFLLFPFFVLRVFVRGFFFQGVTIHCTDAALASLACILHVVRPTLRYTLTAHGLDIVYPSRLYQYILRRSLSVFHSIVAVSHATKTELLARGVDAARLVVIPPGVIIPRAPINPRPPGIHLLLLGRQIRRKGTVWFLEHVIPQFLVAYPDATVTIAGDGPELPRIRAICARLASEQIRVLGFVSNEKKEMLFASSTHFLMPNIAVPGDMEGFGIVCLEARARGLQVIASAREGILDVVLDRETGFLFRSGDARDCLRSIERSLENPLDPNMLRDTLRQTYSWDTLGETYLTHVFHTS